MLYFFIPCVPRGQARARHAVRNGHSIAYKTADQQADERTLEALMMPFKPPQPLSGALSLICAAIMPIPKSKSKKWQREAMEGKIMPTGRPDLDNVAKNVIDAMVRMRFMEDDKQICNMGFKKAYGTEPGYEIALSIYEPAPNF